MLLGGPLQCAQWPQDGIRDTGPGATGGSGCWELNPLWARAALPLSLELKHWLEWPAAWLVVGLLGMEAIALS